MNFIQITDCHLFATKEQCLKGVNTYNNFIVVLDEIKKYDSDLLVITGDFAEDGSTEAYLLAKQALEVSGFNYTVLPGNHDDLANMEAVFKDHFYCNRVQHISGNDSPARTKSKLKLLHLNSVVPGQSHGYLTDATLHFLRESLNREPDPVIVFVHHHPLPIQHELIDQYGIHNASAFLETLYPDREKIPFYGAPATSIQFKPRCNTLEIDEHSAPAFRVFDFTDNILNNTIIELQSRY